VGKGCMGCQRGCEGRGEVVKGLSDSGEKFVTGRERVLKLAPHCGLYAQSMLHTDEDDLQL
jgi:hypothetical protein